MNKAKRIEFGQHIVSDPKICGGDLTFKGTRILVKDVLYLLAKGWDWGRISAAYDNRLSHEAIAEAIVLACESLVERLENRHQRARPEHLLAALACTWSALALGREFGNELSHFRGESYWNKPMPWTNHPFAFLVSDGHVAGL